MIYKSEKLLKYFNLYFDNSIFIYYNKCKGGCLKKGSLANTHSHK